MLGGLIKLIILTKNPNLKKNGGGVGDGGWRGVEGARESDFFTKNPNLKFFFRVGEGGWGWKGSTGWCVE